MYLVFCVLVSVMLQCMANGDYFVHLKPQDEMTTVSPQEYLSSHLDFLNEHVPHAHVYQVYWTLAERLGFYGYCVSISHNRSASILNVSSIIKSVEPIGVLSVAEIDMTMPSDKDVDETLSRFRKNRMAKSEVNLDSFYSTEVDSRCVYDANMFSTLTQPPSSDSVALNASNPIFVYVVDTGIHSSHYSLRDSVDHEFDFENRESSSHELFFRDPHGHGTQVAGLIHQVCSNVRLVDVRVLGEDGTGRADDVVKGLEYIVEQYFFHKVDKGRLHSVINLSFSGKSSNFFKSVLYYISRILLVVGASGDEDTFSCEVAPSSSEFILSVGAATWSSGLPLSGTNYGSCVRIRVAAENIVAPYIGADDTAMREISGSSAATAFISGVAAKVIAMIHSTPRAATALYHKYPNLQKQRGMMEFVTDFLSLPLSHRMSGSHIVFSSTCTLASTAHISDHLVQLLQLNVQPDDASTGGRRAMQMVKNRFKATQRQRLESNYE
mmetsp:Transcript_5201/g.8562  ORF Transcript_5201/g.8562 Transcript_5201/m.8562 type:complete len:495 (-) Transcript_5201:162-1646(-)